MKLHVEVPDELLRLLKSSRLSALDRDSQVRVALAIHLFLTEEVSLAKAAELAGETRSGFERLLSDLHLPLVLYGREQYQEDVETVEAFERQDGDKGGR
jgi:predicted HTH domain antitoxin